MPRAFFHDQPQEWQQQKNIPNDWPRDLAQTGEPQRVHPSPYQPGNLDPQRRSSTNREYANMTVAHDQGEESLSQQVLTAISQIMERLDHLEQAVVILAQGDEGEGSEGEVGPYAEGEQVPVQVAERNTSKVGVNGYDRMNRDARRGTRTRDAASVISQINARNRQYFKLPN